MFTSPYPEAYRYWPTVNDKRHGYVPGLRALPQYRPYTDTQFQQLVTDTVSGEVHREGFLADRWNATADPVVWHALDVRYDQCIGEPAIQGKSSRAAASSSELHQSINHVSVGMSFTSCHGNMLPPLLRISAGMCECFGGRDLREEYISIHFSCIEIGLHKPSWYETELEFMTDVYKYAYSCTRW